MNKEDNTTPIINRIYESKKMSDQLVKDSMALMFARGKLSSIKYHKKKLGKQHYCYTGMVRYWVWEGDNWRVYVSKKGSSLEVLSTLTAKEAWAAWQDYFNKVR